MTGSQLHKEKNYWKCHLWSLKNNILKIDSQYKASVYWSHMLSRVSTGDYSQAEAVKFRINVKLRALTPSAIQRTEHLLMEAWKNDVLCCSRPVPLSLAETCTMPLASMSKVTSIWGTPRGAGGIPTRVNWPKTLLSVAISRSPWHTLISTWVCPSAAVENTWSRAASTSGTRPEFHTIELLKRWCHERGKQPNMMLVVYVPGSSWWEWWCFCWWVWWRLHPGSQYPETAAWHPAAAHQWHHQPRRHPGWLLQWQRPRRGWPTCWERGRTGPELFVEPAETNTQPYTSRSCKDHFHFFFFYK